MFHNLQPLDLRTEGSMLAEFLSWSRLMNSLPTLGYRERNASAVRRWWVRTCYCLSVV